MLDKITSLLGGVPDSKTRNDDELSDKISHRYTVGLLVVFAFVVSAKQYVGDPITCIVPGHFSGSHEDYANQHCWIRNTYYLPLENEIPRKGEYRNEVKYYQWIPIILPFQALLFYLPCLLWRSFNDKSGIDVNNIVEAGQTFQDTQQVEERDKTLRFMTMQMNRYLVSQTDHGTTWTVSVTRALGRVLCRCAGRRQGTYLVGLFIMIKILYVVNVIGQLFLLDVFLGEGFHAYGIDVIRDVMSGGELALDDSPRFPRITMCNFKVRVLGDVHRYTVQCVLPINLFNEKIYMFVWFWMVFVAGYSCFSLVKLVLRSAFKTDRHRFIKKHLKLVNKLDNEEAKRMVPNFVEYYLKQDGVLVLRLLSHNTNTITTTEFIAALWEKWREHKIENTPNRHTKGGIEITSI